MSLGMYFLVGNRWNNLYMQSGQIELDEIVQICPTRNYVRRNCQKWKQWVETYVSKNSPVKTEHHLRDEGQFNRFSTEYSVC